MDTKTFLESVLSDEGHYCVFAVDLKSNRVKQDFVATLPDVLAKAAEYDSRGLEAYFALSTFNDENRLQDNVKHVQSFFLDIDCGESKPYATQAEGLEALNKFRQAIGLPAPLMVDSGRGIHVYWCLDKPVTREEWEPVAEQLKHKCVELGFKPDPAVTADSARILRVPDTHNNKTDPPKRTTILGNTLPKPIALATMTNAVGGAMKPVPTAKTLLDSRTRAIDAALQGNVRSRFKNILDKTAAGRGCAQLAHVIQNQETLDEPLWRAGLSIANFCDDGEHAAEFISKRHPHYNREETLDKMHRTQGPYTCDTFNELNPGVCDECPLRSKIASPIVLGREVIEATPEDNVIPAVTLKEQPPTPSGVLGSDLKNIPTYPKPYFRAKDGGVYKYETNDDGDKEQVLVYNLDLYASARVVDPEEGECLVLHVHLPHDGHREFMVPLHVVASPAKLIDALARQGVVTRNMKNVTDYIMSWLNELQYSTTAQKANTQFGWDETCTKYVLGDKVYTPTGVTANPPSTVTQPYFPMFRPKGTLEGWKQAMDFFNRPGMELHQFMVCAGFGSPIMEFIPNVSTCKFHVYSKDSGLGKTTGLFAQASIYGNYEDLISHASDTLNSTIHRGQVYKNMPLLVDELTNKEPKDLSDYVLQMSSGKERNRLEATANKERLRGSPWSLLSTSTGNTSVTERIGIYKEGCMAEIQRVLEIHANRFTGEMDTHSFNLALSENYGHAGPIYIDYLVKNQDKVRALVLKVTQTVEKRFGLSHENRYWRAGTTAVIVGCIIARKLGLIKYNPDDLLVLAGKMLESNKSMLEGASKSVGEVIADYLHDNVADVLYIKSYADRRTTADLADTITPRNKLLARYEFDSKILKIASTPFKRWCANRQINFHEVITTLKDQYGAKFRKVRMGTGTTMVLPPQAAIVVNCEKLDIDVPEQDEVHV